MMNIDFILSIAIIVINKYDIKAFFSKNHYLVTI